MVFLFQSIHLLTTGDIEMIFNHDDVIKWKHVPRYWLFVRGLLWPLNSSHKGQWRGALMFSLICAWMNGSVNNREAGDLRRHRAHYDIIVMFCVYEGRNLMWYLLLPIVCIFMLVLILDKNTIRKSRDYELWLYKVLNIKTYLRIKSFERKILGKTWVMKKNMNKNKKSIENSSSLYQTYTLTVI